MKNLHLSKLFFICLTALAVISCSKKEDVAPPPTVSCKLTQGIDSLGNKLRLTSFDNEGKVINLEYQQVTGQALTVMATVNYQGSNQIKTVARTIMISGRAVDVQDFDFKYQNGLITEIEGSMGKGTTNNYRVTETTTFKYNTAKQITEISILYHVNNINYITSFEYDSKGNISKIISKDPKLNQLVYESSFTYDEVKHPHQLIKGLPFNFLQGYTSWNVNVPTTIATIFYAPNGTKTRQEIRRTDVKTNTQGYATQVTYNNGKKETFDIAGCD